MWSQRKNKIIHAVCLFSFMDIEKIDVAVINAPFWPVAKDISIIIRISNRSFWFMRTKDFHTCLQAIRVILCVLFEGLQNMSDFAATVF